MRKGFLLALVIVGFSVISSPMLAYADCLPFRGGGGAQLTVKCFTNDFKATCSTNQECLDLMNGKTVPPAGSNYIPPGWTAPNTDPNSLQSPLCGKGNLGVQTAIGCLMAGDPKQLISQLLGWGVVVGGGVAFLLIILAGFQMTTAAGDPKKVQAARELLMSAISGLILIVLSVVFLNFVGVSILGLDKLGFKISL